MTARVEIVERGDCLPYRRMRGERWRDEDEIAIDAIIGMRIEPRTDESGKRKADETHEAHDGAIAAQEPAREARRRNAHSKVDRLIHWHYSCRTLGSIHP